MNGHTRLRLENIAYAHHRTPTFESCAVTIPDPHHPYFLHQDQVCLHQFKQLAAARPFQCLIISVMNGHTRLRLENIAYAHHRTPTFESCAVTIPDPHHPYFLHQDQVCLHQFKQLAAARPFQCLFISIMNG